MVTIGEFERDVASGYVRGGVCGFTLSKGKGCESVRLRWNDPEREDLLCTLGAGSPGRDCWRLGRGMALGRDCWNVGVPIRSR